MTNEEWDRKAEFLLNQQAKFDADMQELKEAQKISEQKIGKVSEAAEHAVEAAEHAVEAAELAVEAVTQLTDITTRLITTTTDGFRRVFESMKHTNEKIDVLVDIQIRTDERMQNLTDMFERHIREDHRGLNGLET